jgi:glycosyltransferase involved in cell wall biosynthesis
MSRPSVSIVTPSYNQGEFIEDTIRSVMAQTYDDVEHIVVDGGSDDDTVDVLSSYEDRYDLEWVSEPDRGQSHAVNKGVERASGDIVGWLNSDDIYTDKRVVEDIVASFEERSVDVLYGDHVVIDDDNTLMRTRHTVPWFSHGRLLRSCFICQPATFFRREVIESCPVDEEIDLPMDYELWFRIHEAEYEFGHHDRLVAGHRRYEAAKTQSRNDEMRRQTRDIQREYGAEFDLRRRAMFALDAAMMLGLRVRGLSTTAKLLAGGLDDFTVDVTADSTPRTLLRQLVYPNVLL